MNQGKRRKCAAVLVATVAFVSGCVADSAEPVGGATAPDGFEVQLEISGLEGPTQIAAGPDSSLLVAQLNGGENDQTGQIVLVDGDQVEPIYEGLDKPTGVALLGDELYVMERNRLSVGSLSGEALEVIADDLPNNGRSQGTLTVTPDSTLLFNTSGSIRDGEVVEDSGILWELEPGSEPVPYAAGFKHAYAHVFGSDGRLWVTEVSDGEFDGEPAADEVIEVERDGDGGWPSCVGDGRPVEAFEGTPQSCADTLASTAVFEAGATPTSLAITPWDDSQMLVALWNGGRVVSIDLDAEPPAAPATFVEGIEHPQHLLVVEQSVWLVDPDEGRILSLQPA